MVPNFFEVGGNSGPIVTIFGEVWDDFSQYKTFMTYSEAP